MVVVVEGDTKAMVKPDAPEKVISDAAGVTDPANNELFTNVTSNEVAPASIAPNPGIKVP
jgi:hypothetical protein